MPVHGSSGTKKPSPASIPYPNPPRSRVPSRSTATSTATPTGARNHSGRGGKLPKISRPATIAASTRHHTAGLPIARRPVARAPSPVTLMPGRS
ncbi:Uncharacterised protein [Mycobacteroides abscessus subsp. abscessus]|nr:Uncharacterised protein [Mycobacteroides abscessus subsp. abscessus]